MTLPSLTCKDAIELMGEYLETALGPELLATLERHLADCRPCVAYLNTYRKTRQLAGAFGRLEMPEEMKRRLRQLLLEQLAREPYIESAANRQGWPRCQREQAGRSGRGGQG